MKTVIHELVLSLWYYGIIVVVVGNLVRRSWIRTQSMSEFLFYINRQIRRDLCKKLDSRQ